MKQRHVCLLAAGVLLVVAGCRDPHLTARRVSRLDIPLQSRILSHSDDWERLGSESDFRAQLQVDSLEFQQLVAEAKAKGFKPLPASPGNSFTILAPYVSSSARGWYWVQTRRGDRDFTVVILDATTLRVIIEDSVG